MNLDQNSFSKNKNSFLKFLSGTVFLVAIILLLNFFTPTFKNLFFNFSSPLQANFSSAGRQSSGWLGSIANAANLRGENENLKKENQRLLSQVSLLQSIKESNAALSAISETCQNNDFSTTMVGIIGLDNQDMLTINKGSSSGISEGMPVIDQNNVLYGKVYKVYQEFSQVILISSKSSIINAQVQSTQEGQDNINGVIKGTGGLEIFLDLVPVDLQINSGEVLTTSCLDQSFPKDILVGRISQVEKNDQKPFQQAKVDPFFNLKNTENLFVITNYKTED